MLSKKIRTDGTGPKNQLPTVAQYIHCRSKCPNRTMVNAPQCLPRRRHLINFEAQDPHKTSTCNWQWSIDTFSSSLITQKALRLLAFRSFRRLLPYFNKEADTNFCVESGVESIIYFVDYFINNLLYNYDLSSRNNFRVRVADQTHPDLQELQAAQAVLPKSLLLYGKDITIQVSVLCPSPSNWSCTIGSHVYSMNSMTAPTEIGWENGVTASCHCVTAIYRRKHRKWSISCLDINICRRCVVTSLTSHVCDRKVSPC